MARSIPEEYIVQSDGRINLKDKDGTLFSLPKDKALEYYDKNPGVMFATDKEVAAALNEKAVRDYASARPGQAFMESLLNTATLGGLAAAQKGVGAVDPEVTRALHSENPHASLAGSIAGAFVPNPAGLAGNAIRGLATTGKLAKAVKGGLAAGAEGALLGAGMSATQAIHDEEPVAPAIAAGALVGALTNPALLGVTTAVSKVIKPLGKATQAFIGRVGAAGEGIVAPANKAAAVIFAGRAAIGKGVGKLTSIADRSMQAVAAVLPKAITVTATPEMAKRYRESLRKEFDDTPGAEYLKELDAQGPEELAAGLNLVANPVLPFTWASQGPDGDYLKHASKVARLYPESAGALAQSAKEILDSTEDQAKKRNRKTVKWLEEVAGIEIPEAKLTLPQVVAPVTAKETPKELSRDFAVERAGRALLSLPDADNALPVLAREQRRLSAVPGQEQRVQQIEQLKQSRIQTIQAEDGNRMSRAPLISLSPLSSQSPGGLIGKLVSELAPHMMLDGLKQKAKRHQQRVAALGSLQVSALASAIGRQGKQRDIPKEDIIDGLSGVDVSASTANAMLEHGYDEQTAQATGMERQSQMQLLLQKVQTEPHHVAVKNYTAALRDPRSILHRMRSRETTWEDVDVLQTLYPQAAGLLALVATDLLEDKTLSTSTEERHFLRKFAGISASEAGISAAQRPEPQQEEEAGSPNTHPKGREPYRIPPMVENARSQSQRIGSTLS